MAVGDAQVFPGFFTPVLTQVFFPKPPATFLRCFCRAETGKKVRLNRGSNSQPPGHESDMLTTGAILLTEGLSFIKKGKVVVFACVMSTSQNSLKEEP